ncbi:MAG: nicotinate phosphoribosyltransferase, partial [Microbacteriaceae bacterium]
MIYKLVARQDAGGHWVPVGKTSAGKATVGGRKFPVRTRDANGTATTELLQLGVNQARTEADRPLLVPLVTEGVIDVRFRGPAGTALARQHRAQSVAELPVEAFRLSRGEPVIPTVYG